MKRGWISIHRKMQEHWLWKEDRIFNKSEAWIDILFMANHKENKILLGNELIEVKIGSFITSELKLMKRWKWSKSKVRAFLLILEKDNMIVKISDTKKTTVNVVNYKDYQNHKTTNEPPTNHEKTSKEHQKDTNNNYNNINNYNNDNNNDDDGGLKNKKSNTDIFLSLDSCKEKYLSNDLVLNAVSGNLKNNIKKEEIEKRLSEFNQHIAEHGEVNKLYSDYCSHFLRWHKKNKKLSTSNSVTRTHKLSDLR